MSNKPSIDDAPTISEAQGVRYLHFGTEWVQGAMLVAKPNELVLEYTAQMMAWQLFIDPPKSQSIGLLGLGAGSLTRFCLKHYNNPVTVVEWNPQVTAACHLYFKLPSPSRLSIDHMDSEQWVAETEQAGQLAVLMVDLYDAQARGPVRDSVHFYSHCRRVLADVGVLTVNLFGAHESFERNIKNLSKAFDGRLLSLPQIDAGNQVVIAFTGPKLEVSVADLLARAELVESRYGLPARKWAKSLVSQSREGILSV